MENVTNGVETESTIVVPGMKVGKAAPKLRKDGSARKERTVVSDKEFLVAYKGAVANGQPVSKLAATLSMAKGSVIQRINSINEFLLKNGRKPLTKLVRETGPRKNVSALASLVDELEIGNGELESLPVDAPISGEAPAMSETEANSDA